MPLLSGQHIFEPLYGTIYTMSRIVDREKAIALRLRGYSYSQIKEKIGVSKSTLHYWLAEHPLTDAQMRKVRDTNALRIEKFRETFRQKKLQRLANTRAQAVLEIKSLTKREFLLAGFFLYWAEGMKVDRKTVLLANTDPAMLRFFISWLTLLGITREQLRARLHVYSDMDPQKYIERWAYELHLPKSIFRNTYVKDSAINKRKNYKGRFGLGTCTVWVHNRELYEKIMMTIDVLKEAPHNSFTKSSRVGKV